MLRESSERVESELRASSKRKLKEKAQRELTANSGRAQSELRESSRRHLKENSRKFKESSTREDLRKQTQKRIEKDNSLLPDGLHPNDEGHEMIYNIVKEKILSRLEEVSA